MKNKLLGALETICDEDEAPEDYSFASLIKDTMEIDEVLKNDIYDVERDNILKLKNTEYSTINKQPQEHGTTQIKTDTGVINIPARKPIDINKIICPIY